ncbi:MAG TPA: replicative DNA helicase, partial [Gammaproteobacteria bacterium]|nr:replicative DNA helicase [Gammaproteobacteria bacterium]
VFEIADQQARERRGFKPIKELLTKALARIDALFQQDSPITGVATGFTDFDQLTAGLQPSDLIIVAGRPSMGKTAFAMNIAEQATIKEGRVIAIFSMEMPGEQVAMRLMSSLGRIDQHKIRTGKLSDDDWPRLTSAIGILSSAKMFIDDTPALTPGELRARCRRIAREHSLGLVIIDYLQLMQVPGTKENRATEISEISRSLKSLAKELNVPIVALSQLNRSLEQRPDKRPRMADLRESGAIEQDADVIVFIYRDEVYDEASPDKGMAEIIISKQRNGPIGTVRLTFLGQYTRFENFIAADNYSASRNYG